MRDLESPVTRWSEQLHLKLICVDWWRKLSIHYRYSKKKKIKAVFKSPF
jgi:hypothetical protein